MSLPGVLMKCLFVRIVDFIVRACVRCVVLRRWPQAVRANGHLMLNSEKVCWILWLS